MRGVIVRAASVDETGVVDVLASAIGDDPQKIRTVVQRYRDDPAVTLLIATDRGLPVGAVGYTVGNQQSPYCTSRQHIPHGGPGLRRRLLEQVRRGVAIDLPLVAETDTDGVGFYTAVGFIVTSLGEKYPRRAEIPRTPRRTTLPKQEVTGTRISRTATWRCSRPPLREPAEQTVWV